jgi:Uma2 family endonuclease
MTIEHEKSGRWKKAAGKKAVQRKPVWIHPDFRDAIPGEEVLEAYPPHPGRRMTEAEFMKWVRERTRAEWVNGEVIIMSPVNFEHDQLQGWLYRLVSEFVDYNALGKICSTEFAVRMAHLPSFRLTDLFFVARGRESGFEKARFVGPPDLIVEIVSPDSVERDYDQKFNDYEGGGVKEYWIVDPIRKRLEGYELIRGKYRAIADKKGELQSKVLKGFFIKPAWLWQKPLPKIKTVLHEMGIE